MRAAKSKRLARLRAKVSELRREREGLDVPSAIPEEHPARQRVRAAEAEAEALGAALEKALAELGDAAERRSARLHGDDEEAPWVLAARQRIAIEAQTRVLEEASKDSSREAEDLLLREEELETVRRDLAETQNRIVEAEKAVEVARENYVRLSAVDLLAPAETLTKLLRSARLDGHVTRARQ